MPINDNYLHKKALQGQRDCVNDYMIHYAFIYFIIASGAMVLCWWNIDIYSGGGVHCIEDKGNLKKNGFHYK